MYLEFWVLRDSGANAIALAANNVEVVSFRGALKMRLSNFNMPNRLTEHQ